MAVLFLDPLALLLLLGLLVYVWLVWRGKVRRWFGRGEAWTVLAWPVPLLAIGVPPVAGGLLWLAGQVGIDIGDGGITDAAVYAAAYLASAGAFVVWPPRWLLPRVGPASAHPARRRGEPGGARWGDPCRAGGPRAWQSGPVGLAGRWSRGARLAGWADAAVPVRVGPGRAARGR
jgi:hypothetical protein